MQMFDPTEINAADLKATDEKDMHAREDEL
jgi:hypothetical protein